MIFEKALQAYKLNMEQQEKSPRTVKGYLQDLNFFKKWLEEEWNGPVYLEDIAAQIEDVKCIPNERDYLTEKEALDFIKEIDHELIQVFTITLLYTGMRVSEALSLTPEDVDIESKWIQVRRGKGNKSRRIPIAPKLEKELADYIERRVDSNQFFATEKTGALSIGRVQTVIRETREGLGSKKKITAHMFRHSFASQLVKKDVNIVSLSKLLGHSNLKTTSIYTHVSSDQLVDAINML